VQSPVSSRPESRRFFYASEFAGCKSVARDSRTVSKFDYVNYWKWRHQKYGGDLRRVGHRRFGEQANRNMYEKVLRRWEEVLSSLKISLRGMHVLDAGAGIGMYTRFYCDQGSDVCATDVSLDALAEIRKCAAPAKLICCKLSDLACLPDEMFDLTHCFDVLYHITDDEDWRESLRELARVTRRYVALHGMFLPPAFSLGTSHVCTRSVDAHLKVIAPLGFRVAGIFPTHYLFVQSLLVPLVNRMPALIRRIDQGLSRMPGTTSLAADHIVVFERGLRPPSPAHSAS
jgi:SAM-dependent methyltransferase